MNRSQLIDRNRRFAVPNQMLGLLLRSKGQDLLLANEQDHVSRVTLPITAAPEKMAELIEDGYSLDEIGMQGATLARHEGIFYPVPAGQYEAASQGV